MKKVSKILLTILCFNFITFSTANAEIVNVGTSVAEGSTYEETGNSQNVGSIRTGQGSMSLDEYVHNKEFPTTVTKKFNAYQGLKYASTGEQLIIAAIKSGLENLQTTINLDQYIQYFKYTSDYLIPTDYYFDTLYEYPELFYPNLSVRCEYSYNTQTYEIVSYDLKITYSNDNATINTMKTAFNNKVQEIKNNYLATANTALEKEYAIHDYIIKNTVYDMENYRNDTIPNVSHTAYGSLVNGIAVCDGYSKAAQLLLRDSGIESGIVVSEEIDHAWNFVKLDGNYYFLDLTWDDPDRYGDQVSYRFFNATTAEMKSGTSPHIWDENGYPVATNSTYSFLRDGNSYKRLGNKLYYADRLSQTYLLNSKDLQGISSPLISDNYAVDLEVYKNNAYCGFVYYDEEGRAINYVYRLNLTTQERKVIFATAGSVSDMYQKGADLIIEYTEDGISKTETISIAFKEDVNADGVIDMLDLAALGNSYNAKSGTTHYKSGYDINSDFIIDIYDITKVALQL